ncbi:putative ribonuclease H-like domain-containing protein [Tanacetum coccineum]|uniref:Ribonuclease H-like domain-containing protein n=1 Tax=Tanacetum coccineum TaxID=301880 RepID=A0ABQ4YIZ3_9ASTR
MDITTIISPNNAKTVENKGGSNTVESNAVRLNNTSAPIIEDWISDDEILTRSGKLSTASAAVNTVRPINTANTKAVNTVRPFNTVASKQIMNHPRPITNAFKRGYLQSSRPFNRHSTNKNNIINTNFNTARVKHTTASDRAVVSENKGKGPNAVKASACWGNPQQEEYKEKVVIDSGCSRHVTGNKCYLDAYKDYDGGFISFGDGKGKIKTGSLDFEDVYFCKELKYNLFSVSQIYDKKNNVLFTDTECLVLYSDFKLLDESQVLLRVTRKDNIYSVDLKNVFPTGDLTCLIPKAIIDESNTWHRRLGHINFKTMNKLVKGNLVKGLPSKIFENDHSCVVYQKGKQHKAFYKAKLVNYISKPLHMLHMDLFGPTNDETSEILKTFIIEIENQLDNKVKVIQSNNRTEFKNSIMNQFCEMKGIKREFSIARTPQQNGVAERKNRTLIEAARTMLVDSKFPTTFWAEAVNTDCYVLNRVLVIKPHNKIPYELIHGRPPLIDFMKPFGCPVTILNTWDYLGKFDAKAEEGYFVGYSMVSKAMRVFNQRTRIVEETLNIRFLKNTPNVKGNRPDWLFDVDTLTISMNYVPVVAGNKTNGIAGTKDNIVAGQAQKEKEPKQEYILIPLCTTDPLISQGPKDSEGDTRIKPMEVDENEASDNSGKHDQEARSDTLVSTAGPRVDTAVPSPTVNTARTSVSTANTFEEQLFESFCPFKNVFTLPPVPNVSSMDNTGIFESFYDDEDVEEEVDMNNVDSSYTVPDTSFTKFHKDHPEDQVIGSLKTFVQTRHMTKTNEKHGLISSVHKIRRTNHKAIFQLLLPDFLSQRTQIVNQRPEDPSWWKKNKARLVAQGHTQEEGIDYDEVFALVARIEAIRLFLAYASFKDYVVYQMDVNSAFLYGKIEEEVYVCQPPGFEDPHFLNKVYKVEKALYGLHQAPRAWYETLSTYLQDNGFHRGQINKTLFIKRHKDDILLVQIYVDDIIFGSTKKEMIIEFEKLMHDKFQMSSMGELYFFLGLQVKQKSDGIFISQDKYVAEILKKFDFASVKTASTPMETNKPLIKDEEAKDMDACQRGRDTKIPHSSGPPVKVGDEAVYKELGDSMERATTTASSLETEQDSAEVKMINGVHPLQALIDKKKPIIMESSIRSNLHLDDEEVFINQQLRDMSHHKNTFVNLFHIKKIFANMKREGKDFSRRVTPLFDTMLVQASEEVAEVAQDETVQEESVPTPSNDPLPSSEDSMQLNDLMLLCSQLQKQVLDLEKDKSTQAIEISSFKKRVDKLEKGRIFRTTGLKRFNKGRSIEDIDGDVEVTLVNETQDEQNEDLMFDTGVLDDDEVFVDATTVEKEEHSTMTGEAVTTVGVEDSAALTIPTTVEETLAQTLMEIRAAKPKAKRIIFHDMEEQKDQVALDEEIARDIQAKLDVEIIEEEKLARQKEEEANIALIESWDNTQAIMEADFELAQKIQIEEQGEITIEERSKLFVELMNKRKKHFAMLIAEEKRRKPPTKAQKMNQMSTCLKNMGGYKHNQLKSKSYEEIQKLFDNEMRRVNTFIPIDSKAVKSKKGIEESSKGTKDELRSDKTKKVEGSEEKATGSRKKNLGRKRARKEQQQECLKRQKLEDDNESDEHEEVEADDTDELKKHLVIKKDDDIAIDVIPLATKPLVILDYKLHKEGLMAHYKLIRADGSSNRYTSIIRLLQGIDREDLQTLWKLVKTKHGDTRPEDKHERVMWGDLKVMFEPDIRSDVWRNLQGYKIQKMNIKFRGGLLGLKGLKGFLRLLLLSTASMELLLSVEVKTAQS